MDLYAFSLDNIVFKALFEKRLYQNYLGEMQKILYINAEI